MEKDRTSTPELTIADVAALPGDSAAARLRRELALEALADPVWVAVDERRRQRGVRAADMLPVLPLPVILAVRGTSPAMSSDGVLAATSARRPLNTAARLGLAAVVGAVWGALVMLNPAAPEWYAGWADFGTAVTWRGTALFGVTFATMYALGTMGFTHKLRGRTDVVMTSVAAVAAHWSVAVAISLGALAFTLRRRHLERVSFEQERGRIKAKVDAILAEPLDGPSELTIRWGRFSGRPADAADILCARALELEGHDLSEPATWSLVDAIRERRSPRDTAACVLAAEIWLIACDATEFEQAASIGPSALGAYAAILARSLDEPTSGLHPLPGEPAWPATETTIAAKLAVWRAWIDTQQPFLDAGDVMVTVAADLAAFGGGEDRCARAARFLAASATRH